MRKLSLVTAAVLATAFTATIAVAQTQTTPPTRPNRMGPPAGGAQQRGAQQPGAQQPGAQMRQRAQMARQLGGGPAANLLRMKAQLELTDDQVKRLEALRGTAPARINPADMMRAQADLLDATRGDANLDKARAAFDRMARLKTDQQIAQLKARQDVRNVLTAAQKAKVDAFATQVQSRRAQAVRGRDGIRGGGRIGGMNGRRGGRNGGGIRGGRGGGMQPGMGGGMQPGMRPGMQPGMQPQGRQGVPGMPPMAPNRVRPPEDSIPR